MGKERQDDLTTRVLAWQHRHPLAARLEPSQVQSVGWLALPFVVDDAGRGAATAAPGGGGAADRSARAGPVEGHSAPRSPRHWRPAFDEAVLESCSPRRLARWVLRHGVEGRPPTDGLPVRELAVGRDAAATSKVVPLWVCTARLDSGQASRRLLVGGGPDAPVLGRRLWSRPRLGIAAATAATLLVVAVAGLWLGFGAPATPGPAQLAATAAGRTSGSTPASASSPELGRPATLRDPASPPKPREPDTPAVAAAGAEPAPPRLWEPGREARDGRSGPRWLDSRPKRWQPLDDSEKRQAREAVAAARLARGDAAASAAGGAPRASVTPPAAAPSALPAALRATVPTPVPTAVPAAVPAAVPVASGPTVWAVSTRVLRTRFESEQMLIALRAAAARNAPADAALRFEVLPVGSDWRAVSWPFTERDAAERLRAELQARGVRVEVVAF